MPQSSFTLFDKVSFGSWMKDERKEGGYSSADAFADAIREKTGYKVTGRTILNLENGKYEPCLSLLIAMSYTLYGTLIDDRLIENIRISGNGRLAAVLAFPEYFGPDAGLKRPRYMTVTYDAREVGVYVDYNSDGSEGRLLTRPNPLNLGNPESEA